MNILLIGNGGHGKVVEEVSKDCGYEKIAFLDDNSVEAIGKIEELEKFVDEFEYAFVAIGNNKLCGELMHRLEEAGYKVPVLIHSSAYVSSMAKIGKGTVIEPKAIINANTVIERGCIISVGSIIDHDVKIGECCHINSGAIVKAGAEVNSYIKVEAGKVIIGKQQLNLNISDGDSKRIYGIRSGFFL